MANGRIFLEPTNEQKSKLQVKTITCVCVCREGCGRIVQSYRGTSLLLPPNIFLGLLVLEKGIIYHWQKYQSYTGVLYLKPKRKIHSPLAEKQGWSDICSSGICKIYISGWSESHPKKDSIGACTVWKQSTEQCNSNKNVIIIILNLLAKKTWFVELI